MMILGFGLERVLQRFLESTFSSVRLVVMSLPMCFRFSLWLWLGVLVIVSWSVPMWKWLWSVLVWGFFLLFSLVQSYLDFDFRWIWLVITVRPPRGWVGSPCISVRPGFFVGFLSCSRGVSVYVCAQVLADVVLTDGSAVPSTADFWRSAALRIYLIPGGVLDNCGQWSMPSVISLWPFTCGQMRMRRSL